MKEQKKKIQSVHKPVLSKEVIEYLNPRPNENFIDATFGEGGHSTAILERISPKGKVLGIEIDPALFKKFPASNFSNRLIVVNDSYVNIKKIVNALSFKNIKGVLFDLGMSSWHIEKSGRGFSFKNNEPLDMRFNPTTSSLTAERILNHWRREEIEKILKEFGEERYFKKIAERIIERRKKEKIKTTFQLVEIIKEAMGQKALQKRKIHFATKTFMALRIAVNRELENLKKGLEGAYEVLEKGGRIVTISFHSLEDRVCKNFFREKKNCLKALTKKPVVPSKKELQENKRARSAKLRAAIKIK